MKHLKFRIWDGNNKKYLYPDIIELNIGLKYEQYTGYEDVNGKKIYENDYVLVSGIDKSRGKKIEDEIFITDIRGCWSDYSIDNALNAGMIVKVIGNINEGKNETN